LNDERETLFHSNKTTPPFPAPHSKSYAVYNTLVHRNTERLLFKETYKKRVELANVNVVRDGNGNKRLQGFC